MPLQNVSFLNQLSQEFQRQFTRTCIDSNLYNAPLFRQLQYQFFFKQDVKMMATIHTFIYEQEAHWVHSPDK